MNATVLLEPIRDLYRRRLWPVAVLLVAAAVAAPVLLATPEEAPVVAAAGPAASEGLDAASIVSVAGPDGTRRRVLGARKDPFAPSGDQPRARRAATTDAATTATGRSAGSTETVSPFGGGASAPISTSPSLPTPTFNGPIAPAPAVPVPAAPGDEAPASYSLRVRLDGGTPRSLDRLDALPSAEEPLAIYLGVLEDGKTAVFLIDETVLAQGDGRCNPTPDDCQRLYLRKGDTQFLDVQGPDGAPGVQLQLDVLGVRASDAGTAQAATIASTAGRRALRARFSRVGRLRYDRRAGVLRKISVAAHRAEQARARAAKR